VLSGLVENASDEITRRPMVVMMIYSEPRKVAASKVKMACSCTPTSVVDEWTERKASASVPISLSQVGVVPRSQIACSKQQ
jgi:hypothetical protein